MKDAEYIDYALAKRRHELDMDVPNEGPQGAGLAFDEDAPARLRVLMISDFPADFDRPRGGVESVAYNLAIGLCDSGVDLTVIRFGVEGRPIEREAPFEIIDIPRRRPGSLGNWLVSPREIRRVVDRLRPHVVHVQGVPELYRGPSPPPVLTIHGIPYRDAIHGKGWARRHLQPLIMRLSFDRSLRDHRHVIAISPYVGEELAGRDWLRLHAIPNPVEDVCFAVDRDPAPATILYVGVLSTRKNITGLVEAAQMARESIPDLTLRLGGPWLGDAAVEVNETIARLEMRDAVELLGPLSRNQILEELRTCSCLALASLQETAPMAVAEAMAAGAPVVASRAGGIESMLEHGVTGLTSPVGDNEAFGNNLVRILQDRALQEKMGRAARVAAEERYRLDRVVEKTCKIYRLAIREQSG